jgi:hypothetical protein
MRRSLVFCVLSLTLGMVALFFARGADAKVEVDSDYSKTQTYNGALRYLRVDLGYEILEKDVEAGYILFRFEPSRNQSPKNGSLEVIETKDRVKVVISLPQLPSYHETSLRDGLLKKLRTELGEPPKKKKDPPPQPPADGGTDSGEWSGNLSR